MPRKIIGRYQAWGTNGHYIVSRWDGTEYRVMHGVPTYSTFAGAVRKAKALHKKDYTRGPTESDTKRKLRHTMRGRR